MGEAAALDDAREDAHGFEAVHARENGTTGTPRVRHCPRFVDAVPAPWVLTGPVGRRYEEGMSTSNTSRSAVVGKVALVTGLSRGIGAAVAERLAADGFAVVINYAGNAELADKVVARIGAGRRKAIAVKADVSDAAAMEAMFAQATKGFGGIDVLVNNAGIMKLAPLAQTDDESFDQQIAINLKGVFNGLRLAAKQLRDGGRIVSFSSSVVGLYQPTYGVYAATKAAVEAMTHVLSKELGPRGITVNVIAPGPVETELFMKGKEKADVDRIAGITPLRRPRPARGHRPAPSPSSSGRTAAGSAGRSSGPTAGSSEERRRRAGALVTGASLRPSRPSWPRTAAERRRLAEPGARELQGMARRRGARGAAEGADRRRDRLHAQPVGGARALRGGLTPQAR